ncbi:MAG: hypothetical protein OH319_01530 [Candidatus Parvarchaeota archaeon]|nr:hypothetical protein [Candidatus Jingweiarchaeum tengchongense]MCW1297748.1 hypothetical protein [Candidatus Jingweiarchaeum tengchongense]MCW1299758.1 hypothetical protein [Candidatus Jingweiarchaeum tengchongense]MCW1304271.1 hypothetical protein [Candidatus Jingweiarchaeum tengchongense]MCW1305299.1 hypothetical protein [Candidatus Jingweiarchaeum tengchongense]
MKKGAMSLLGLFFYLFVSLAALGAFFMMSRSIASSIHLNQIMIGVRTQCFASLNAIFGREYTRQGQSFTENFTRLKEFYNVSEDSIDEEIKRASALLSATDIKQNFVICSSWMPTYEYQRCISEIKKKYEAKAISAVCSVRMWAPAGVQEKEVIAWLTG